jgi:hypothetical protein
MIRETPYGPVDVELLIELNRDYYARGMITLEHFEAIVDSLIHGGSSFVRPPQQAVLR